MAQEGYKKLIVWGNAKELRALVYKLTRDFPKSEYRRVSQMNDAARSIKQNIQEGYGRNSLREYIHSLEISKGSAGELLGDLEDAFEDGLLEETEFKSTIALCGKTRYLLMRLIQSLRSKL